MDNYDRYVQTQSETALRHLASAYVYDDGEPNAITLRSNVDEVSQALRQELQQRLAKAGVAVDEARLTNLSYAPEIAQVMLRRQQAEAVIAARQKIVHGAVSMVDMALRELAEKEVVQLDDERKAAMVSNLLVVLCARIRSASRRQRRNALQLSHARKETLSLADGSRALGRIGSLGAGRIAQCQRPDRIPPQASRHQAQRRRPGRKARPKKAGRRRLSFCRW